MFSFTVQSPKIDRTTFKIYNLMKKKYCLDEVHKKKWKKETQAVQFVFFRIKHEIGCTMFRLIHCSV